MAVDNFEHECCGELGSSVRYVGIPLDIPVEEGVEWEVVRSVVEVEEAVVL